MNTKTAYETVTNVSRNERAFRAVLGMGILVAVIAGALSAPAAMFTAAMVAVYLVMSAIMGIDPVYSLARGLTNRIPGAHHRTGSAHA
jgi:hypothetical protein